MALSKYWSFQSDDNHDDLDACLSVMDSLELVAAQSHLVERIHYGVMFQRDGSLTIRGIVKFYSDLTNVHAVRNLFEDCHVLPIRRHQFMRLNNILDRMLQTQILFTITVEADGQGNMTITVHSRILS